VHHLTRTFETLEPRHALSGISVAIDHGVLRIDASDASNTVSLERTLTRVRVLQTAQAFDLAKVRSVDIILSGDTDLVTLQNTIAPHLNWAGLPIAIHSAGGDDRLETNGRTFYFGGLHPTLTIDVRGGVKIDGRQPDWFDKFLPENDVGVLVRQLAADRLLSRADMLQVFALVAQQNVVGREDFTSLQTIVAHAAFFKDLPDVQCLANFVVNNCLANAHYLGQPLGDLSAGSTGQHLQFLVNKWFLGLDHPEALHSVTHDPVPYHDVLGTLFDGPPDMHQIHQGADGDCFFLAAMESIAIHKPQVIENMFIDNGDGTYAVRFFNQKQAVYVTIDSMLPVLPDGHFLYDDHNMRWDDPTNVLWSAFAEKGYAQMAELGWSRPADSVNSYAAIDGGHSSTAMEQITSQPATSVRLADTSSKQVSKEFLAGRPVVIDSHDVPVDPHIVPSHAYAMVGYNAATQQFELFNPWGFQPAQHPALVWLTWQEILDNFGGVRVGSKL
jgi:Calpain family cysteine protease